MRAPAGATSGVTEEELPEMRQHHRSKGKNQPAARNRATISSAKRAAIFGRTAAATGTASVENLKRNSEDEESRACTANATRTKRGRAVAWALAKMAHDRLAETPLQRSALANDAERYLTRGHADRKPVAHQGSPSDHRSMSQAPTRSTLHELRTSSSGAVEPTMATARSAPSGC